MNKEIKILGFQYFLNGGELKKKSGYMEMSEHSSIEAELLPYLNTGWNIAHVAGDGAGLLVFLERLV